MFLKNIFCTSNYATGNKQVKSGAGHFQRSKSDSLIVYLNVNHIIKERKYYGK